MSRALCLVMIMVLAAPLPGQMAWDRVERLRPGQRISVEMADGEVLKGSVAGAGSDSLELNVRGRKVAIPRANIAQIHTKSRAKGAFRAGIVSFAIAAPIGAYAGPYLADWGNPGAGTRLRHGVGWGLFFGGIGAGIGALTGTQVTVYRAKRP